MGCSHNFRIGHSIRQENQIPGGYIGDGHILPVYISIRYINLAVGQRRTANGLHIGFDNQMLGHIVEVCNFLRALQLNAVALMIVETDGINLIACFLCYSHTGAAVKTTREQDYCFFFCHFLHLSLLNHE